MPRLSALLLLTAIVLLGCQPTIPPQSLWHGSIDLPNGRTVDLTLDLNTAASAGSFVVGDDITRIPEVQVSRDSVHLIISEYGAAVRLRWNGTTLTGAYFRYRKDTISFPCSLTPTVPGTSRSSAVPAVALVGTYRVFQKAANGTDSTMTGKFWTRNDSTFGTLIAPDGDVGMLAGRQSGDTVVLHRFNGWQILRYEFQREGTAWNVTSYVRDLPPTSFRIEARPGVDPIPVSDKETRALNTGTPFQFSGIAPDGRLLTQDSPEFKGKYVLVDIMGTWCHNCLDAAPVLQHIADEYRTKDLVVVGMAFELSADTLLARKNLSLYQRRYGLTYPLIFCGTTDAANTARALHSQLKDFYAYPTTLFLDRHGILQDAHVGFRGPGTGDAYQRELQAFYTKVDQLLKH